MTLREQLCAAMRTLIAESDITMTELARKTGMTRRNIYRILKSDNVSLCTFERIFAVLGADIEIIVNGETVKPLPPDYAAITARRRGRPPKAVKSAETRFFVEVGKNKQILGIKEVNPESKRSKPAKKPWSWKLPEPKPEPKPETKPSVFTAGGTAFEVGQKYLIGKLPAHRQGAKNKLFSTSTSERYEYAGKQMTFIGKYGVNYTFKSEAGTVTTFTEFDLKQRGMCRLTESDIRV